MESVSRPTAMVIEADKPAPRNDAIDILRGAVMVVMALDHARDFVMGFGISGPTNLATTTVPLFLTRWITHFCAPVFVLLAGTGAALARAKRSPKELAWFLLTRGAWLVLLEISLVRFAWMLNLNYHLILLQVIWVIGCSMIVLALFVFMTPAIAVLFCVITVAGHNLLDSVHASEFGKVSWAWQLLHESAGIHVTHWTTVMIAYPLVPWVGVMIGGYALGCYLPRTTSERRQLLYRLGILFTVSFVILRAINRYGDPNPWATQPRGAAFTVLSFLNCAKYPPSLDYLLMTLGPALLICAALLDRPISRPTKWLRTFGRVPLFYYLLHLFVLHAITIVSMVPQLIIDPAFRAHVRQHLSPGWALGPTYATWAVAVFVLYPLCRWYAAIKQRSQNRWLSYL